MKKAILFFLIIFILGCTQTSTQVQTGSIAWLKDLSFAQQAASRQAKPILIDFYTEWCSWCKRLDKDTYANSEVADFAQQFICVKIDADKHPQLAKKYNVRGFPTTVFLKPDGSVIKVVPGYMGPKDFLALLKKILR